MKKLVAAAFIALISLAYAVPVIAAEEATPQVEQPYETVVAKNGQWHTERVALADNHALTVAYSGAPNADLSLSDKITFTISSKVVLKGVYLPYPKKASKSISITFTDDKGNVYGPFKADADVEGSQITYVYIPETDVILPEGEYTMAVSDPALLAASDGKPVFLIKAVLYSAYMRYLDTTQASEGASKLGDPESALVEGSTQPAKKNPIAFTLDNDSVIEEIVINTYNGGKGAAPGIITINDADGKEIASYQSVGGTLDQVANGVWAVMPRTVFPAGNYTITVSDPNVLNYDKDGNPLFYVTVSPPPETRYDFTGTYIVNLDNVTKTTLMGPGFVDISKLKIKDFELTILDKGDTLECIGEYEGMPFSQACTVTEESYDKVTATASLALDLTKTTYKARIGGNGTITITKPNMGKPNVVISGTGFYQRPATAQKGADFNTYTASASGVFKDKTLPPFVIAALNRQMGAGNIPGPDSPAQAAAGLLFPPLAALIAHIIDEAMKAKSSAGTIRRYSPEWYAKNYPGKTKEQLAWIMLADAMGNTDEPDAEDRVSVGDNEAADYAEHGEAEQYEETATFEEPQEEKQPEIIGEPFEEIPPGQQETTARQEQPTEQTAAPEQPAEPEQPAVPAQPEEEEEGIPKFSELPDEITLVVDTFGREVKYVKDKEKGQFINTETGEALNFTHYFRDLAPFIEKTKERLEQERQETARGDSPYSKMIRESDKARQEAETQQKYKDSLARKYGTHDEDKIRDIISENQAKDQESSEAWNRAGDRYGYAENTAKITGVLADTTVDALGSMTGPAGKGIRAGYKVLKSISGEMADKGVSASNLMSGAVKGGSDAATDFVDKAPIKAVLTVAGETAGGAINEGWKGAKNGLIDGISKAGSGALTDKLGGRGYGNDMATSQLKSGKVLVATKSGNNWKSKVLSQSSAQTFVNKKLTRQAVQSGVKAGTGLLDEFGIKPYITEPLKK